MLLSVVVRMFLAGAMSTAVAVSHADAQTASATSPEARAVAFLSREVPRWRREHPCYSCHNNGDAARALITAARKGHTIGDALDDTLVWLRDPKRWNDPSTGSGSPRAESRGDKMPQGGIDDKPLARIQFASALHLAVDAGRAPRASLDEAVAYVAADQKADGSWQLDTSQSLGSPATYGTVLATASALRTLRAASRPELAAAIGKGDAWLRGNKVETVLDAAAVLLGLERAADDDARAQRRRALDAIRKGQAPDGGWGPFVTSPPEVFDTALVLLALAEVADHNLDPARQRGRAFLVEQQLPDGSWPETTRPTGQESYAQRISTTGWALLALLAERAP